MRTTSFFAALIASTALVACGDSGEQPASGAQPAEPESTGAETSAPEPAETPAAEEPVADEPAMDEPAMEEPAAEAPPAGSGGASEGEYLIAGLTGDPAAGRRVFVRCQTCHVIEEGVNRVGPSLYGIFGRTAGTVEGFRYSSANANSGVVWDAENMFEYLENPRAFIPGTIMAFPGIRSAQERADVIAYIKDNGGVAQ
ncbi:MAG: cytochrome c family protein [Oceanicaulis sp.]|nr:cytochrome c family protein [Oceanicaulis sp.]